MAELEKPFKVGYRNPPKSGQFVKGQSGNPKGRPKGSLNVSSTFLKIARERVRITVNGRTKTITKLEAVGLQLVNRAMSGDNRAAKDVLNLHSLLERTEDSKAHTQTVPDENDKEVMGRLLKRIREAETPVETEEAVIDREKLDE